VTLCDRYVVKPYQLIKTCVAGLVLIITRTLRAALTKLRVYVCVLLPNHSTDLHKKLFQQIKCLTLIATGYLD